MTRGRVTSAVVEALTAAFLLSSCTAAEPTPTPSVHVTPASCNMATRLPLITAAHMIPFDARSAVLCDEGREIRVLHVKALVRLLNQATPVRPGVEATIYCPLDTGAHISIVVTGLNMKSHQPDGDIVTLQTSGCGFADSMSGRWSLTKAAWTVLRKLDPSAIPAQWRG